MEALGFSFPGLISNPPDIYQQSYRRPAEAEEKNRPQIQPDDRRSGCAGQNPILPEKGLEER
jgi:hypothetical protein